MNISLRISDEDNKKIYHSESVPTNKTHIVQLKNNRYAALRPLRNEFMPLEKILKSFSDKELKENILNRINTNDTNYSNDTKDLNDLRDSSDSSSDLLDKSDLSDASDLSDTNNSNNTNDSNDTNYSNDPLI